MIKNLQNKIL